MKNVSYVSKCLNSVISYACKGADGQSVILPKHEGKEYSCVEFVTFLLFQLYDKRITHTDFKATILYIY